MKIHITFFLFSAISGQLADTFSKPKLIRVVKALEIAIMSVGLLGFVNENIMLLIVTLFLMGLHSTLFGPVKYNILPHILHSIAMLSIVPVYCKDLLKADESVVTLFFVLFSIGIGAGSILSERLSSKRTELGLVPIGRDIRELIRGYKQDEIRGDLKSSKRISCLTRLYPGGDKPFGCKGAPDSEPA